MAHSPTSAYHTGPSRGKRPTAQDGKGSSVWSAKCRKFHYDVVDKANIKAQAAVRAVEVDLPLLIESILCDAEMPLTNKVARWPDHLMIHLS